MNIKNIAIYVLLALVATACGDALVPRPRGYFRISLPEPQYQLWDSAGAPYEFEKSTHSVVVSDREQNAEPYWINISYPSLKCQIHVTYRNIKGNVEESLEDSRKLVYKHTVKADAIGESYYEAPEKNVYGALYRIKGNAATPLQFSLTDSTRHMFRGSLYFYCKPNKDSLAPVVKYLEEDVAHIMETFKWRNN